MSVMTSAAVWRGSQHSGSALLMMLAIADFSDDKGVAYPAVSTLAEKTRMKPRNANYLLSELQASGELVIKIGAGPRGTNLYRIALDRLCGPQPSAGLHHSAGLQRTAGVQPVAEVQRSAGLQAIAAGAAPQCSIPLHRSADKPSLIHQEPSTRKRAAKAKIEHPLFAEFYAAYPRKVGRVEALKNFAAINPDENTLKVMLTAISAQALAQRCAAGDWRYVPHPATWLSKRRWEDEVPPTPSSTQQVQSATDWRDDAAAVRQKGVALGLGDWDEAAFQCGRGEHWRHYRQRVLDAAGSEVHA